MRPIGQAVRGDCSGAGGTPRSVAASTAGRRAGTASRADDRIARRDPGHPGRAPRSSRISPGRIRPGRRPRVRQAAGYWHVGGATEDRHAARRSSASSGRTPTRRATQDSTLLYDAAREPASRPPTPRRPPPAGRRPGRIVVRSSLLGPGRRTEAGIHGRRPRPFGNAFVSRRLRRELLARGCAAALPRGGGRLRAGGPRLRSGLREQVVRADTGLSPARFEREANCEPTLRTTRDHSASPGGAALVRLRIEDAHVDATSRPRRADSRAGGPRCARAPARR